MQLEEGRRRSINSHNTLKVWNRHPSGRRLSWAWATGPQARGWDRRRGMEYAVFSRAPPKGWYQMIGTSTLQNRLERPTAVQLRWSLEVRSIFCYKVTQWICPECDQRWVFCVFVMVNLKWGVRPLMLYTKLERQDLNRSPHPQSLLGPKSGLLCTTELRRHPVIQPALYKPVQSYKARYI